eukprot:812259-Prymnesium_polylepis.1
MWEHQSNAGGALDRYLGTAQRAGDMRPAKERPAEPDRCLTAVRTTQWRSRASPQRVEAIHHDGAVPVLSTAVMYRPTLKAPFQRLASEAFGSLAGNAKARSYDAYQWARAEVVVLHRFCCKSIEALRARPCRC